ncbi:MAG: MATE family efflux transporter [Victivallaceae bacterium]|nr:MATE family efflux transporter [Victivallaceae bacterium]
MRSRKYSILSREQIFGKGGYLEIVKVASPLVVMSASHVIMLFCDRLFLAHAGTVLVAAAMPVGLMYFSMFCIFTGIVGFTSPLVAQLYGSGDHPGCVRAAWNGIWLGMAGAIAVIIGTPLLGRWIIVNSGMRPELLLPSLEYLHGLHFSGAFACLAVPMFCFFSGRGITWPSGVFNTLSCALNIVLDYMLIFGNWGAPKLGIYGGGLATTIAGGFSLLCVALLFFLTDQKLYPTRRKFAIKWEYIRKIMLYGTPSGTQVFAEVAAFTFMCIKVGAISVEATAATTIALSVNNFSFSPLLGVSDATAIVTGQYIGRGRRAVAQKAVYCAWRLSFIYMLLCGTVYLVFPDFLAELFAPDIGGDADFGSVVSMCGTILACAAVFNLTDSIKYVFMGGLRGAGDTLFIFLIVTGGQWLIMVPGIWLIVEKLHGSVTQIWYFLTVYGLFEAGMILWRFRSGRWRNIELVQRRKEQATE